jgi:hypothetical protein
MLIIGWTFSLIVVVFSVNSKLKTEYEWKYFDYAWLSEEQRNLFLLNGRYDPTKMVSIDVDQASGKY